MQLRFARCSGDESRYTCGVLEGKPALMMPKSTSPSPASFRYARFNQGKSGNHLCLMDVCREEKRE
jgi:hypothetical protein